MSVHPARLAALFTPPLPEAVVTRLLAEPRFANRIDALAGLSPAEAGDPADLRLLALGRAALDALAPRAGIVLHARPLLREIRGPVIAALTARFGEDALTEARRHPDLSDDVPEMPEADRIEADGRSCLAAWIADLPPDLHRRAMLLWPDDGAVPARGDARTDARGPAILRRLAGPQ